MEADFGLVTRKEKVEKFQEDEIKEKVDESENEENRNQGDEQETGVTLDYFIDKNYPQKRTKDQILNELNPPLPDYLKLPYPIIKKKLVKEDETEMFEKCKEMLKQL